MTKQFLLCTRGSANFFGEEPGSKYFGSCRLYGLVTTTQLCYYSMKPAADKTQMNEGGWVPNKLYLQKQKHAIFGLKAIIYQPMSQVKEKYMMHPQTFNTGESPKKDF